MSIIEMTYEQRWRLAVQERNFIWDLLQHRQIYIQKMATFLKDFPCGKCGGTGYVVSTSDGGLDKHPCEHCVKRHEILQQVPSDNRI